MVSNNFMEIQTGGGVFELGNPDGRGAQTVLEIQVEGGGGGGSKNRAFRRGGVDFFWNNPILRSYRFSPKFFPPKWSPLNAQQEKKWGKKSKKKGRGESKK